MVAEAHHRPAEAHHCPAGRHRRRRRHRRNSKAHGHRGSLQAVFRRVRIPIQSLQIHDLAPVQDPCLVCPADRRPQTIVRLLSHFAGQLVERSQGSRLSCHELSVLEYLAEIHGAVSESASLPSLL